MQSFVVILSGVQDLIISRSYEILQSLRSLRMTGEGDFSRGLTLQISGNSFVGADLCVRPCFRARPLGRPYNCALCDGELA